MGPCRQNQTHPLVCYPATVPTSSARPRSLPTQDRSTTSIERPRSAADVSGTSIWTPDFSPQWFQDYLFRQWRGDQLHPAGQLPCAMKASSGNRSRTITLMPRTGLTQSMATWLPLACSAAFYLVLRCGQVPGRQVRRHERGLARSPAQAIQLSWCGILCGAQRDQQHATRL